MTAIAALVHNGYVYMGGDSATSFGTRIALDPKGKVFKASTGLIMGLSGYSRVADVVRYGFTPPALTEGQALDAYMRFTFAQALRDFLKEHTHTSTKDGYENTGLWGILGWRGQLWELSCDLGITQSLDPYMATGSGGDLALAVLHVTPELEPRDRIDRALRAAEHYDAGVRGPFTLLTDAPEPAAESSN